MRSPHVIYYPECTAFSPGRREEGDALWPSGGWSYLGTTPNPVNASQTWKGQLTWAVELYNIDSQLNEHGLGL